MRCFLLLFTTLFLLDASCTKEEYDPLNELPPATQEGRYKMGCLINGEPWKNRGGDVFNPSISGSYGSNPQRVNIIAFDREPNQEAVRSEFFVIKINPLAEGVIPLKQTSVEHEWASSTIPKSFYLDTLAPSFLEVNYLNEIERIIAGTFSFTLIDETGTERLEVTDGRFDVIYQ